MGDRATMLPNNYDEDRPDPASRIQGLPQKVGFDNLECVIVLSSLSLE